MAQSFTTDITQWQGVDDEPTAGSDNLVKSGGVAKEFVEIKNDVSDIQASLPQNDYYAILESGVIYGDDGKDGDSDTAIRCRNYIPITSDPTVVIIKNSYSANFGKRFYDDEKRYLGATYSNDAAYLRFSILNTTMADEPDIVITIDGNEYAHFVYQKVATKQKLDEVDRRLSSIEVQVPNINGRLLDVESLTNTYQEPQEVLSAYVSNENLAEFPNWTTVIAKVNPNQTVRLVSQSIDTIRYVIYSDKPSIGDNSGIMVGSMVTGSVTAEIPNNLPSYYIAFSIWANIETELNIHIDGSIWQRPNIDERVTDLEELTESSIEPQEVLSAYVSNENILEYSYWTTVIAKVKPNQTVTLASHSVDSIRYMLYSKKPSIGDNSAITVGSMVTGSSSAQIPNILPFYYIAFSIQVNKNLEQGIHIDGNIWVNPNLKERVTDLEEQIADTEDEISSLTDAFERFLPKLDYGDLLYNKCPNFVNAMRNKKKDVTVCLTGTSLTQGNLYVSQRDDRMERPPLMQGNDLASAVFDTLIKLWPGQKYRRFDHPSVIRSSSTWVDSATNAIWDDSGQKKNGYTGRTLDANAYISITVPSDAWRFNFIYRTDSEGGTCTVSIAEGNNKMEVFNGTDWVEANGYTFSMLEPAPTSTKGNTCYQKRLNMRCKNNASGGINSIGSTKALTITKENNNTTSFNVVGFEWSPREFMLTVINGARGGHCWGYQTEISVPETNNLEKYQDLDIWGFNPDLILCEVTAINWAAGSQRAIAYDPNWFVNLAKRHYYNEFEDCPISLYEKSNGYQDCEVVFYGDTLSIAGTNGDVWDENGNPVFGTVVNAASNGNTDNTNIGRVKTGVENYDAVDSYMASKNQLFIPITERIIDFAQKVYGSYPNAFAESRAKGNTLSYDETHLNDRGVRLWSSFIIPLFNF